MTIKQVDPIRQPRLQQRASQYIQRWWAATFKHKVLRCPNCSLELAHSDVYKRIGICERCGRHFPITSRQRIEMLADPRSFVEYDRKLRAAPLSKISIEQTYLRKLKAAQRETHLQEAVVTGSASIDGRAVVLIVLDFRFLGGSMGWTVGEKITLAFERAAQEGLPVVAVTSTGGARIQEGMFALMQMAKTAAAAERLHSKHVPFITVLTHPTTGGVYASFANLADIIVAEPHALIGFAGPRVVEALTRQKLPPDSHRAEFLFEHGMVDAVIPRSELRAFLARTLGQLCAARDHAQAAANYPPAEPQKETANKTQRPAWEVVTLSRRTDRPTAQDYISRLCEDFVELHGDRLFGDDPAIIAGLGRFEGRAIVVIGLERGHGDAAAKRHEGKPEPEGYRKTKRLMHLAAKFGLPIVTLVDTPGANPSYESEKRGIAMSLAQSIGTMTEIPTPTVAVIIGEGGSGGALALAVADKVLMQENAIYSVISPEGASAILYGDASRAEEVSTILRLTAPDLKRLGIIDAIVAEPEGGAHTDVDAATCEIRWHLSAALARLAGQPLDRLLEARYQKYRRIGMPADSNST